MLIGCQSKLLMRYKTEAVEEMKFIISGMLMDGVNE